ncbi:hypothetical protein VTK56DRAFT_5911 [Thermocarpiscus australiensis]
MPEVPITGTGFRFGDATDDSINIARTRNWRVGVGRAREVANMTRGSSLVLAPSRQCLRTTRLPRGGRGGGGGPWTSHQQLSQSTGGSSPPSSGSPSSFSRDASRRWAAPAAAAIMGFIGFGAGMLFTGNLGNGTKPNGDDTASTPITYATRTEMLHTAEEIAHVLGQEAVSFDADVLEHHGHSD